MQNLTYLSEQGTEILLTLLTRARIAGGDMILSHVNDMIKPMLSQNRLNTVFTVTGTTEEALVLVG